jgi:DNA-binding NtrC family response regulator
MRPDLIEKSYMPDARSLRRRLLLIEDDRMVRETLVSMLEEHYDVLQAVSVRSALIQLSGQDAALIELILLDCLLPEGNVAALLAVTNQRAIPVVLISGDPRQGQAVDPNRPFLAKPFTQAALLHALDCARC